MLHVYNTLQFTTTTTSTPMKLNLFQMIIVIIIVREITKALRIV